MLHSHKRFTVKHCIYTRDLLLNIAFTQAIYCCECIYTCDLLLNIAFTRAIYCCACIYRCDLLLNMYLHMRFAVKHCIHRSSLMLHNVNFFALDNVSVNSCNRLYEICSVSKVENSYPKVTQKLPNSYPKVCSYKIAYKCTASKRNAGHLPSYIYPHIYPHILQ